MQLGLTAWGMAAEARKTEVALQLLWAGAPMVAADVAEAGRLGNAAMDLLREREKEAEKEVWPHWVQVVKHLATASREPAVSLSKLHASAQFGERFRPRLLRPLFVPSSQISSRRPSFLSSHLCFVPAI